MTIFDALKLIAIVRGVPQTHAKNEVMNYIDALGKVPDETASAIMFYLQYIHDI